MSSTEPNPKPFRKNAETFAAVVMNQSCCRIRLILLGNRCSRLKIVRFVVLMNVKL